MAITRSTRRASAHVAGRARRNLACWSLSRDETQAARLTQALVAGLTLAVFGAPATSHAQAWRMTPSFRFESTLTDNVDLSPNDARKSDWVNQFTPELRFAWQGARSHFAGNVSLPILLYARTSENNYVAPTVDIAGNAELIEKFLFIDASANVSQQYPDTFRCGAQQSRERDQQQVYGAVLYAESVRARLIGQQSRLRDSRQQHLVGWQWRRQHERRCIRQFLHQPYHAAATPLGWSLSYDRTALQFQNQPSERLQIARANALYRADPALELSATVGYENNELQFTTERGVTYGVGGTWHPTDRTNVDAKWEHRFFGASYNVLFDHRTPLSVWSLRASRDITNYPQQLAALPGGADVAGFLNSLLLSKVPDPTQRQSLVDQIIHARGLPATLTAPVTLLTRQVTLVEQATATFGILGARNSILFNVYHSRQEPVEGARSSVRSTESW